MAMRTPCLRSSGVSLATLRQKSSRQRVDLFGRPSPVFGRKSVERQVTHPAADGGAHGGTHGFNALHVTVITLLTAQLRPAAVPVLMMIATCRGVSFDSLI